MRPSIRLRVALGFVVLEVRVQDKKASQMFLLVAILLGVIATVVAFAFIQSAGNQENGPQIKIVVAGHDLKANASLLPERDLQTISIPQKFSKLALQSLDVNALGNYKGQRVNRRIQAGQPVFLSDLSAGGELEIRENMRALTLPAEAGLIIPGDYVKIMVVRANAPASPDAPRAAAGSPFEAELVGSGNGYRVLAVGGSLSKTRSQATAADQYESGGNSAKTVTLEVTEAQAKEIGRAIGPNSQKNMLLICPPPAEVGSTTTAASAPGQ
jgi:Flp pilus assembly protein CpaB